MYGSKLRFFSLSLSLFLKLKLRRNSSSCAYSLPIEAKLCSLVKSCACLGSRPKLCPAWVQSLMVDGDILGRPQLNLPAECKSIYSCVESAMASLDGDLARQLKFSECVRSYGFSHALESFATLVGTYSSATMYPEVRCLLLSVADFYRPLYPDVLFLLLCKITDLPPHGNGSITTLQAYGCLIQVLAESSMLYHAVQVLLDAKRKGIEVGIQPCNFLLKCFVDMNEVEIARNLFVTLSPNIYTFTIMMDLYTKKDTVDLVEADKILMEMDKSGLSPDGVAHGMYLRGLCDAGRVERAWELLCDLQERGQPCNYNYCYNTVMLGFCLGEDMDKSMMVFKRMKDCGLSPDVRSYNILIEGFRNKGDLEKACKLLYEVNGYGIMPTDDIYSSLLFRTLETTKMPPDDDDDDHHHDGNIFSSLLHCTPATSIMPPDDIYRSLMHCTFVAEDVESAEKTFRKLKSEGYRDESNDHFIYFILLYGYRRQWDIDNTHRLWKEMIDNGFTQDVDVMMCMMEFNSEFNREFN